MNGSWPDTQVPPHKSLHFHGSSKIPAETQFPISIVENNNLILSLGQPATSGGCKGWYKGVHGGTRGYKGGPQLDYSGGNCGSHGGSSFTLRCGVTAPDHNLPTWTICVWLVATYAQLWSDHLIFGLDLEYLFGGVFDIVSASSLCHPAAFFLLMSTSNLFWISHFRVKLKPFILWFKR